jgi:hypothetical protein
MSVLIKSDEPKEWRVSDAVEGDGHDHCVGCDTDVEASGGFGGEYGTPHMWSQYVHDRRDGGCGAVWTRTTGYGQERNEQHNMGSKWLTTGAAKGRAYSLPSDQYQRNWEVIFGSTAKTIYKEQESGH